MLICYKCPCARHLQFQLSGRSLQEHTCLAMNLTWPFETTLTAQLAAVRRTRDMKIEFCGIVIPNGNVKKFPKYRFQSTWESAFQHSNIEELVE